MALSINTNTASMNAQRSLAKNQNALATNFQRLSSGVRIGSAKDDAAGLAIGERFTAQIRGINQASRNANDGISLAQTAEGALSETTGMLQRLRELSVQSANDTNSSSDRQALQQEADALVSEIDRIATQTNFNGRNVLDGSFSSGVFHVGANANQSISVSIGSARSFNLGATANVTSAAVTANALGATDLTLNGVGVRASIAADDTRSSAGNAASAISKAAAINASTAQHGVSASVNANTVAAGAVTLGAITTGEVLINGVDIGAVAVQAGDADSALQNAINAVSGQTGVTASVTGGALSLTAADGRNITIGGTDATGSGTLAANAAGTTYSTIALQSDRAFTVGGANPAVNGGITAGVYGVNAAVNVGTIDISSQSGANSAIGMLDTALRQVSNQRAGLGAVLSRLESAVSNMGATSENLSAARSRIMDADFASETASFSKNQILQQASSAMLAQANVSNQVALSLLG